MPTPTTRLGLIKQAQSENVNVDLISDSFDTVDDYPGIFVCTSTSRPTNPWEGQVIFETDTGKLAVRIGSDWAALAARDLGSLKGYRKFTKVAAQTYGSDTTISGWTVMAGPASNSGSFISSNGTTFTLQRAGLYQIEARIAFTASVAGAQTHTLSILHNGANRASTPKRKTYAVSDLDCLQVASKLIVEANDTVTINFNAGNSVAAYVSSNIWNSLEIEYLGAA